MVETKSRVYNIDIEHNPYDVECCIATCREHPHLKIQGIDYDDVKKNIRDLIRCQLDMDEGDGAGNQNFTCNYHHG